MAAEVEVKWRTRHKAATRRGGLRGKAAPESVRLAP